MQSPFVTQKTTPKKHQVAECCTDLFLGEIVRFLQKQYPSQTLIDNGITPEVARAECEYQVHTKLETMGYQTGLRVMDNLLKELVCTTD